MTLRIVEAFVAAYLLGAIPFGVVISRLWSGIDIRQYGSGNIGATNVFRVLGPVPGALVMLTDVLKGFAALWLARHVFDAPAGSWTIIGAALLAIIGHNWSVFLKFQGGKGANTSLGVVLALDWRAALICFGVWLISVAVTRYVSISSMLATVVFPVAVWLLNHHRISPPLLAFSILAVIFSIYRHRSNIKRLLAGKEPKFGQRMEPTTAGKRKD